MKIFAIYLLTAVISSACARVESRPDSLPEPMNNTMSFYDFKMNSIDGKEIDFSQFKGKKVLLVNTASACGYTPQYAELQKLHEKFGDKIAVVGFPSNDFGGQEPGSNDEISGFCKKNYGVTFLMMEKVTVKGKDATPLYKWLSDKSQNGWNSESPSWNFCKYMIGEDGKLLKFYNSSVKPMSEEITASL